MRIYDRRGPTRVELETKEAYASAEARELVERRGDDAELARFVIGRRREFRDFGVEGRPAGVEGRGAAPVVARVRRRSRARGQAGHGSAKRCRSNVRCAGWTGPSCRAWS